MKVFNRRNVLKGGLVGSMAAGFASFVGASHAAEPAAKAPAQNDKNTYDVIVLGAVRLSVIFLKIKVDIG